MTNSSVNRRNGAAVRAGTRALSLLAVPINAAVIQALGEGPRSLADLRRAAGSPPQTTMRGYLRRLAQAGVVERHRGGEFPGAVAYELTDRGRGLLGVSRLLSAWLALAPAGPLELGAPEAKSAIKALVDGWNSTMVRALAARPLSLTDLDSVISTLNYPSLERRLTAMRHLSLLAPVQGEGRSSPYGATGWLRSAIAPLAAAIRWERQHLRDEAPRLAKLDVEAAFLLTLPLLRPAEELGGTCRLAVQIGRRGLDRLVGVMIEVRAGAVTSCITRLEGSADAWAIGSTGAWLSTVLGHEPCGLELGGERLLVSGLAEALRGALAGVAAR